jgi:cobalt-precorrin 5A hydrolase
MNDARYFAGIGCRRGCSENSLRTLLEQSLQQHGLQVHQVHGLASIDKKRDEDGLLALATTLKLPLQFFSTDQLTTFADRVAPSAIVKREVGTANVAEACALAVAEMHSDQRAELIIRKCKNADATFALARISALSLTHVFGSDENP